MVCLFAGCRASAVACLEASSCALHDFLDLLSLAAVSLPPPLLRFYSQVTWQAHVTIDRLHTFTIMFALMPSGHA